MPIPQPLAGSSAKSAETVQAENNGVPCAAHGLIAVCRSREPVRLQPEEEDRSVLRSFARRAAIAAVPLITLPVMLLAAAPGTALASAPAATISFQPQAQLVIDGSEVAVTVDYSCPPAPGFFVTNVSVTLQQAEGFGAATGTATCDDQKHMLTLDVFGPGLTTGSAAAFGEVDSGTITATTNAELKVS
jgi:hypothetical protein